MIERLASDLQIDFHKSFRDRVSWNRLRIMLTDREKILQRDGGDGGKQVLRKTFKSLSQKGYGCDLLGCAQNNNHKNKRNKSNRAEGVL